MALSEEERRAGKKAYKLNNREKVLATKRAWVAANKEKISKARKEKYAEREKALQYAWRKENPDALKLVARRGTAKCNDAYVAKALNLTVAQCSPELLEMKHQQILLHRALKELNSEIKSKL